jgi:ABC-type branched-subunit amino acid transport system permease subunit
VPALNLALPPSSPFHVPTHFVVLCGKWLTYALLAVALDLVWGIAASSPSATARSSRSAATPWACT